MQFQTDKTTVYMSHPATSECLIVTTVNDADLSGEDGPGSVGHIFVVVYKPNSGIWAFQTDKTVVHISQSETSDCLYVTVEDAASAGDDNGHSDHHYACNGDGPIALAD
ncbi:uncharacterized protein PAN0_037d6308 [Moesziomyces antarcticus]|uniref:Uncharacterized protein n=1 Tax=Pseudozyma antarctica TaxID=84753 RepID=A0A081CN29_PSEA2|nr:uncharacterized protein PAN0_037d6308 [Moesziomyces antarcticus]GAK68075.1 hypothetical protein PAN0_037d6308 [Moesziomyces antarcticus]